MDIPLAGGEVLDCRLNAKELIVAKAFDIIQPDATLCGTVSFRAKYDFSVTIEGAPIPEDQGDAALPDEFLDAGALPTLHDRYGISTEAVTARIKAWL